MANPITWQNVTGPAMGNPAQFMQMATQGVEGAFDKLGAVLKQREEVDKANWDVGKANNTQAFLDQMSQYRTPAEFQAAQLNGSLDTLRKGFEAQIDRGAVRNAENSQLAKLQQGVTAGIAYNNAVVDDREAPRIRAAQALYTQGNVFAGDLEAANVDRGRAALADFSREVLRRGVTEGQTDAKAKREVVEAEQKARMYPGAVDLQNAQVAEVRARAANIPVEQARLAQTANLAALDRLATMRKDAREDLGKTGKDWVGSKDGQASLLDGITKGTADKETAQAVLEQVTKALNSNPKYANLPSAVVQQIALGNKDGVGTGNWWDTDNVSKITAALDKALLANGDNEKDVTVKRADITAQMGQINAQIDAAERLAFPDLTKRLEEAKAKAGSTKSTEIANPFEDTEATNLVKQSVGTKTEVSVEQLPATKPLMEQQEALEKAEINLGILKKHTPEVQKYLDDRKAGNKKENAAKELKRELYNNGYTAAPMGMQYTNEDIQGPIDAAKRQRAAFEKAVEAAKRDR